jgi:hypothetical protein
MLAGECVPHHTLAGRYLHASNCSHRSAVHTVAATALAEQIEALVGEDDAYEQAQRHALALLEEGLHLGGRIESTRDEWHDR